MTTKIEEVLVFEKELSDNTTEVRVIIREKVFNTVFPSPLTQDILHKYMSECFRTIHPESLIQGITETGSYSVN